MYTLKTFRKPLNPSDMSSPTPIRELFSEVGSWLVSLNIGFSFDGLKNYSQYSSHYSSYRLKYKNNPHLFVLYSTNAYTFQPSLSKKDANLDINGELKGVFVKGGSLYSLSVSSELILNVLVIGDSNNCIISFGSGNVVPSYTSTNNPTANFATVYDYITSAESSIVQISFDNPGIYECTSSGFMEINDILSTRRTGIFDSSDNSIYIRYAQTSVVNSNWIYKNLYLRSSIIAAPGSQINLNNKSFYILQANLMLEV